MNYYEAYKDVWNLHKKYAGIQQSDDAKWQQFINESGAIAKTYENNKFIRDLLSAISGELERQSKGVSQE